MKRKNASKGPQLNRKASTAPKKSPVKTIDKKWLIIGAAALIAAVIFTAGLVRFYSDGVVARVNGIAIRSGEVTNALAQNSDWRMWADVGMMREASEEAAREVALTKLFEDYARRNNIPLTGNESTFELMNAVIDAAIADPNQFTNFEAHMLEDAIPAAESLASEILARAHAGEDFDELVATYSDDGMPPEGYAFLEGDMVPEFCEATRNLEIGEISGLVQTEFGFHIIKRIDPPGDGEFTSFNFPLGEDDEMLGAKHILIAARETALSERQRSAVFAGFEAKLEAADLVFLRGLDNIQLP